MNKEEIMWAQNARSIWIVQGDRNIKYFQTVVKQRRARNRIIQLKTEDGNITDDIKEIEEMLGNTSRIDFLNLIPNRSNPFLKI